MNRREYIRISSASILISASGCSQNPLSDCPSHKEASVKLRQTDGSSDGQSRINPIVFEDITVKEQEIVRNALENGEYRKCPAADPYIPEPLNRLAERANTRASQNENNTAYLKFEDQYYKLGIFIEDTMYSAI